MPIRLLFLLWGFIFSKELKKLIKNLFTDSTEYKLAILGMPGSGKTYFLNFLRNKKINVSETTIISKPYDSFDYITRSDKKIVIEKGMDISGSNDDRIHYEKIMQDAHVIFYFFDISKYFSEINYQRECNSRFEDLHKFFTVNKSRKKLLLFATHLDKCKGKKDKILFNFKDLIKEKEYKSLIDKLYLINMLNYEELKQSVDKIFEKKWKEF